MQTLMEVFYGLDMSVATVDWAARLDDKGAWAPLWLGLCITIGYLLVRCAFDGVFLATWGFPDGIEPFWQSDIWWPEIVNATLMGYIPAVLLIARRGADRDLIQLRPRLQCSDAEIADIRAAATGHVGPVGRVYKLSGIVCGVVFVFHDPSLSMGSAPSLTHPAFMWALLRMPVFFWLIFTLIGSEVSASRTYLHMGRNLIEVDLLDVQSLSPFGRKGLRSALIWVTFLLLLSLFWLGEDTASPHNPVAFVTLLTMATATFVIPLIGVHHNIQSVKRLELDRLREQIRVERAAVMDGLSDENSSSQSLADVIAYHQLIDRTREWPIDAANLLKFFLYLLIGLGSWLGGALVERLLSSVLEG